MHPSQAVRYEKIDFLGEGQVIHWNFRQFARANQSMFLRCLTNLHFIIIHVIQATLFLAVFIKIQSN